MNPPHVWRNWQRVLNAEPAPRTRPPLRDPIPVEARIVWEVDGETWQYAEALTWTRDLVYVRFRDVQRRVVGHWVRTGDVHRTNHRAQPACDPAEMSTHPGPAPRPIDHRAACPDVGSHYRTEVNKGSINMRMWQGHLNDMYKSGYRLSHVLEQDGNTVQVFEHAYH